VEPVRVRPSADQLALAVESLSCIPYFPVDRQGRYMIQLALGEFCESQAGLSYTVKQAVLNMRKWLGIPELRGIYCAGGFNPLDGKRETATLPELEPAYEQTPKLLPPPPPDTAELEQYKTWVEQMKTKLQAQALREERAALLYSIREKPYEPPDWLKNLV
jgi:hypothetical protein